MVCHLTISNAILDCFTSYLSGRSFSLILGTGSTVCMALSYGFPGISFGPSLIDHLLFSLAIFFVDTRLINTAIWMMPNYMPP